MEGFTIVIDSLNQVKWRGLETGVTTAVAINPEEGILCLHVAGHKYWSARSETSYAPAEYRIYRIAEYDVIVGELHKVKLGALLLEWRAEKSQWPGITLAKSGTVVTPYVTSEKRTDVKFLANEEEVE